MLTLLVFTNKKKSIKQTVEKKITFDAKYDVNVIEKKKKKVNIFTTCVKVSSN